LRQPSTDRALFVRIAAGCAVLLLCRLWLGFALPLTDTTEARFGEMARQMTATGDWLVPQHDDGVPYLAKPPLAMWLSAAGIELLGANELAPRLPILLCALLLVGATFEFTRAQRGARSAAVAAGMLASSLLFFIASAAVMTDMVLTASVAVALLAFWRRLNGGATAWGWLVFVALGIGLLAKGPLAAVLTFAPILAWSIRQRRVREVLGAFPWVRGLLLTVVIAVPWYIAAELRNPGFLEYFLIGEHLGRFLISGWQGDLYGRAHALPRGTVWLFFLIGTLPWSLLCMPVTAGARARIGRNWRDQRALVEFLGLAALCSLLLFTFSGNVIFPYALPALPFAVLIAALLTVDRDGPPPMWHANATLVTSIFLVLASVLALPFAEEHTQKPVVAAIARRAALADASLYYWRQRFFSAEYYSRGAAKTLNEPAEIEAALSADVPFALVVERKRLDTIPADVRSQLEETELIGAFAVLSPRSTQTGG
jgi:4-amino-4-deoxy-L-arabinose transferase-like glycosyltransferase